MLLNIIAAILIGVLIFFATKYVLWPLTKMIFTYLFILLKWLIFTCPVWLIYLFGSPSIKPIYILFVIVGIAVVNFYFKLKNPKSSTTSYGEYYVLNTRSKVARKWWDPSADEIGDNNRVEVIATERELLRKGYRMKKDD